jgi:hypothetical protein
VVAPPTANVTVGGQQQFTTTVSGTGSYNSSVNWTATGGTITSSGLFTSGQNTGSASVVATSVQDSSVTGVAAITVTAQPVTTTGWYGTLHPSDGSTPLSLDFDLTQQGSSLSSDIVLAIADPNLPVQYCNNFWVNGNTSNGLPPPSINNRTYNPLNNDSSNFIKLSGSVANGQVSLTLTGPSATGGPFAPITLTGTMSGSLITGTYSITGNGFNCFDVVGGTFSFTQYGRFTGQSAQATLGAPGVPFTVSLNGGTSLSYSAVGAPFNFPASPVYAMLVAHAGRFFYFYTDYANYTFPGGTSLIVYGLFSTSNGPNPWQAQAWLASLGYDAQIDLNPTTPIPLMFQKP